MSGKADKLEKGSGSKMLKKARSFREDVKGLIKRRPSNSSTHGLPSGKPKIQVNGDRRTPDSDPDLEKLQAEVNNVYRSLRYIKAVVDQEKLQIVPSTATVILDTVNDVFTILHSFFMNQDSTTLISHHNKVCQSLAHFVRWSDDLLLHGYKVLNKDNAHQLISALSDGMEDSMTLISHHNKVCQSLAHFVRWSDDLLLHGYKVLNKDNAHQLISALSDGMEELTQICIDKWEDRHNNLTPQKSPAPSSPNFETPKRSSLPDIPLSPREREILEKTSDLGLYDNPGMPVSRSSDSVTMNNNNNGGTVFDFSQQKQSSPPPKPPLPQNADVIVPQLIRKSLSQDATDGGDVPPPLPDKTKRRSHTQNMLEMVSNAGMHAGNVSPNSQSPHNSMIVSGNLSLLDSSINSSNGSLHSQISCESPSSSLSSGLNHSAEELVTSQRSHLAGSFSKTMSDSKLVKKQTLMKGSHSECTVDQINQLTQEIDKLTKLTQDMEEMTKRNLNKNGDGKMEIPPPLPMKKTTRLVSTYDNVPDGMSIESGYLSSSSSVCTRTVISRTMTSRMSHNSQTSEARLSSSSTSSTQSFSGTQMQKSNTISFSHHTSSQEDAYSSSGSFSSASHSSAENLPRPPPLPPKQRHIHAYMQTIGTYTQPQGMEYISRHSINFYETQWQRHQMELSQTLYPRSNTISVISDFSSDSSFGGSAPNSPCIPALPAKRRTQWQRHQMELSQTLYPRSNTISVISDFSSDSSFGGSAPNSPCIPALPAKRRFGANRDSQLSTTSSQSDTTADFMRGDKTASLIDTSLGMPQDNFMEQKRASAPAGQAAEVPRVSPEKTEPPAKTEITKDADSDFAELNPLDDIDVSDQLVYKAAEEEGPDIRGGSVDALIVHAAAAAKSGSHSDLMNQEEFMYQEAFLTTYRTFISSKELIDKLLYRFNKFQYSQDIHRKKTARNAFSLLIRVIDLMSLQELDDKAISMLMELVFELLCQGDLSLARVLRRKLIEKCEIKKTVEAAATDNKPLSSISVTANPPDLLHFKSHEIAEQMTLIDAELFQRIEISEVLLWAKEQSEELSPNLTTFTEHFNKMSYWCRSRILLQNEAKERERYMVKFIKIMRHLRKMSNFNSYLALLSALDSAPVRRLDWQRQSLEALKEFCQLIDSSASFRAYRLALAETEPPCIPYIGLILQDLTFINIGNQDLLQDSNINFAKRWQQFHILDSMRRFRDKKCGLILQDLTFINIGNQDLLQDSNINFAKRWQQFHILDSMRRFRDKKCKFEVKKNEKIITMFDGFSDYLGEEALWQISEEIKPRGGKKKAPENES